MDTDDVEGDETETELSGRVAVADVMPDVVASESKCLNIQHPNFCQRTR